MEQINLNKIHQDLVELKKEMEKMKLLLEEDFELADDVVEEIEESRSRDTNEFISHEKMREEFSDD